MIRLEKIILVVVRGELYIRSWWRTLVHVLSMVDLDTKGDNILSFLGIGSNRVATKEAKSRGSLEMGGLMKGVLASL